MTGDFVTHSPGSGLAVDAIDPAADPSAELVAAATALEETPESVDRLGRALAAAELVVLVRDTPDSATPELVYVDQEGLRWLPVWSAISMLALHWREAGRGDEEVRYGTVPGAELIRHGLPQLPPGTGLVLDPGQPHGRALPPAAFTPVDGLSQPGKEGS